MFHFEKWFLINHDILYHPTSSHLHSGLILVLTCQTIFCMVQPTSESPFLISRRIVDQLSISDAFLQWRNHSSARDLCRDRYARDFQNSRHSGIEIQVKWVRMNRNPTVLHSPENFSKVLIFKL